MRLALELGEPNVDVLKRKITSRQFAEWMAFFRVEQYGPVGMDVRFAQLMSVIANSLTEEKFKPEDFMPDQEKETKDPEKLAEMVKQTYGVQEGD